MNTIYWQSMQYLNELTQSIMNYWASLLEDCHQSTLWIGSTEASAIAGITIDETANLLAIKAHLPNIDIKDIHIEVTEETLLIRGKWPATTGVEGYFHPGSFKSLIPFPSPVHPKTVLAEYKDNVLIIRILKQQIITEPKVCVDVIDANLMLPQLHEIEPKATRIETCNTSPSLYAKNNKKR
ncbi:Hsp20/alpha crystallin family protein [Planktothrix sp. FACHB-1355]|uniref:Hsp20/alpha crystallin family protein n=1 Tax=Aerosakkonema funiforme FACHB-1375 TaxID=2949571 RepID=A0A926ZG05_9CYAN|nr:MULTISPECIES: Hsp20/alpha crystallin family protein [Oscillatoriales]MBD2181673.1 Hsp20/alpha crystallin family protein [Aerosakkonema funiforme FACHB-1375]MBD3562106.1 Hsp20/alpha crystallin family protein [Planktothrix sp. FACHB-1355]